MYATRQDMIDRYGQPTLVQLTDIEAQRTGEIDDEVLNRALDDASAEIDGYLAGRTITPLPAVPALIKAHCCRLAHFLLLRGSATDADRADVKDVRDYLYRVARGEILLPLAQQAQTVAADGDAVQFEPGRKDHGREWSEA